MNYFFALELPGQARQRVWELSNTWKQVFEGRASWYGPADYHITLKFLGNQPPERADAWITVGETVATAHRSVSVRPAPPGAFPSLCLPSVLWAGVGEDVGMTALADALESAVSPHGITPERRHYRPHITIARVHTPVPAVLPVVVQTFDLFMADRFVLMETLPPEARRKEPNMRYNIVHTFPFSEGLA